MPIDPRPTTTQREATRRRLLGLAGGAPLLALPLGTLARAAATATSAPTRTAPGAGLATLAHRDHGTRTEIRLWFAADVAGERLSGGPFAPAVARATPSNATPAPLVVISHGTGGMWLNHYPIAEALARAGCIVASFDHPGDNYRDRSMIADPRYFHERPRQISRVLDTVLADPAWAARIDRSRIAAIGHSAGGHAVAALLGGRPAPARLRTHCATATDDPACALRDPSIGVSSPRPDPHRLPDTVSASGPVSDPRIRAAVLLAPLGAAIADGSLAQATQPIRLIGAERDEVLARRDHYEHLRAQLPRAQASLATGAGHFAFIAPIEQAWKTRLGPVAIDPPGFDRIGFQRALAAELAQWMLAALVKA